MTLQETAQGNRKSNGAAYVKAPPGCSRSRRRIPVDQILPRTLQEQIEAIVRDAPDVDVTAQAARMLGERFDIQGRFGVSTRRFRTYLRRLQEKNKRVPEPEARCKQTPRRKGNTPAACGVQRDGGAGGDAESAEAAPAGEDRLRAHRLRQASIASILDATFGSLADCNPELWARRAYLMLVGMVYDRLACADEELPAKELVSLAKGLAEARRAEVRAREHDSNTESEDSNTRSAGPLPENFADIVRQVYGTNYHTPSETSGKQRAQTGNAE